MKLVGQHNRLNFKEFEIFFQENFQAASLVAFRYLADRSLVEDIVQESFVVLWEKRQQIFTNKEDLRKYLLITVRNRTISYLRSIKVKYLDLEAPLPEANLTEPEKLYDDEELAIRILKATEKLPSRCREIFMLAYAENLSYHHIAERLSISKNTVKTQMVIAYRVLREELKELYLGFLVFFSQALFHWEK
ncbi:MAG: sigma-70 family RNA polymerase sigma factor [Mangrovibacterium sp.]